LREKLKQLMIREMRGKQVRAFLTLILVYFLAPLVYAQNNQTEALTISTYYPAPYGVYRHLKLNPSPVPTDSSVSQGVIYYDQSDNVLRYHNNTVWVNVTGGGGFSGWAVITVSCPWGSDYTAGSNSGWGNQCNIATNNCCILPNCPAGWTDAGVGINLTGVSCPRHKKCPGAGCAGGCTWSSTEPGFHPVAVGNIARTCVKKGATVMTNSTTWWSDHSTHYEYPFKMGWGDQCVPPNFDDCYTEWHSSTTPKSRVLPTCPVGWTRITMNAKVNQVSCWQNLEASDSPGCYWDEDWSQEHPLANGEIVAICEKNN
jgi:hypothetical protein